MRATFTKALLVGAMLGLASLSYAQFTTTQIGGGAPGSIEPNGNGSYSVIGGGNDIWSCADEFTYHYVNVSGDFDVRMRVDSLEMAATWTKAGLMARETTDGNSRMAFSRVTPTAGANDVHFGYRTEVTICPTPGGAPGEHEDGSDTPQFPNAWLRLQRSGNHIISYSSHDGYNWNVLGNQDTANWTLSGTPTPFAANCLLGIAVSRHSGSLTTVHCEIRDYGTPSGDVIITRDPGIHAVNSGQTTTFSIDAVGGLDFCTFQWKRDGTDISGATGPFYTTPPATPADHQSHYSVTVHNPISNTTATSGEGTLLVDVPVIVQAGNIGDVNKICIRFSRPIDAADAANPSLYSVTGGVGVTGAAPSATDPTVVVLSVSPSLVNGTAYTVTVHDIHDAVGTVQYPNPATASFQDTTHQPARVLYRRYENITGGAVANLTGAAKYPNSPDFVAFLGENRAGAGTTFQFPQTGNLPTGNIENFGAQVSGKYIAPLTGNYTFAIAADDNAELWLSTDSDPAHKVRIAFMPDWTGERQYITRDPGGQNQRVFTETVSAAISLVAGQQYYLEALYKEGGGGDHVGVAVQRPGDPAIANGQAEISIDQFAADPGGKWIFGGETYTPGDVSLTGQPADQHVVEGNTVHFTVTAAGTPPYTYTWYDNGTPIPNSNTRDLAVFAAPANNGHSFHAVVQNLCSKVTSGDATLTVDVDLVQPTIVDSGCLPDPLKAQIVFSEPITTASATALSNYAFDQGITINNAQLLSDNKTVILTLDSPGLTPNQLYNLTVQGIVDRSVTGNVLDTANLPITGCICAAGLVYAEMFRGDVGPNNFRTLTNNPKFPNNPDSVYFLSTANWAQTPNGYYTVQNEENYGFRFKGWFTPAATGNYQFSVHADDSGFFAMSTDSNPRNLQQLINAQGDCGACTARETPVVPLTAGQSYYFESMFQEGGGGDYLEVKWKQAGGTYDFLGAGASTISFCYDPQKNPLQVDVSGVNTTVEACRTLTLSPVYNISPLQGPVTIQWQQEFNDIPGATNKTLTIPHIDSSYDNALFTVKLTGLGGREVVSEPMFITVLPDADAPTIVRASGDITLHHITLSFSEEVDPSSSTDVSFYNVVGPSGPLTLTAAVPKNGSNVVFTTFEALEENVDYTITIQGGPIHDFCNSGNDANVGDSATFKGWLFMPGLITFKTFDTGGGNTVNLLTGSPLYPDSPRESRYISGADTRLAYPNDTHEAYGGQLEGFVVPPVTGNFIFYINSDDSSELWLNKDGPDTGDPAGAVKIAEEPTCCENPSAHSSAPISLTAGQRYYFRGLWKEGVGGDYMQVRAKLATDPTDPNTLPPLGPDYVGIYVNPVLIPTIVPTLPTTGMLPIGSLARRGFDIHTVQVATNIPNLLSTAELMLAGGSGPNLSTLPFSLESGIINYSIEVSSYGSIPNDKPFPGIPGGSLTPTDNIAMEALTYLELNQGFHAMIVNSDDGFRVTPALCAGDPNNATVLGAFDGGRGASDSPFVFYAPADGLYPMRLIWQQGGGGANVEWIDVRQGVYPTRYAVNGDDSIKAFSASQFTAVQSGSDLIISWNSTVDCPYRLQTTGALQTPSSATVWTDVPGGSPASVPIGSGSAFFRLIRP